MKIRSSSLLFAFLMATGCGSASGTGSSVVDDVGSALQAGGGDQDDVRHVLLISVDGLHDVGASKWIAAHSDSALAELAGHGVQYSDAHTPTPSDSFPGLTALVTGGSPKTTGIYYDDSYDRTLFPPGSACQGNREPKPPTSRFSRRTSRSSSAPSIPLTSRWPRILRALRLNPGALETVRKEGTSPLPALRL